MKDNVGSEHTINGKQYSAEGHFVHYKTAYKSFAEALGAGKNGDWEAIAVVGVLYDVKAQGTPSFKPMQEGLKQLGTQCGKLIEVASPINMMALGVVENTGFIFRYNGSLTTPPCTEAVVWSVFGIPSPIGRSDLELFRKLKTCKGEALGNNYRSVQATPDSKVTEVKMMKME